MATLIEGLIEQREPSLVADLLRTAGATGLTAGAHAIKGLTLGLLDPTQEVAGFLGEDIYGAAPGWARTGAEIAGSIPTVTGALKLARFAIPGVGALPRVLQGFAAGAGLGAAHGLIEGEPAEDVLAGSLLEGVIFGGLEGLAGIPAMIKKRKLKDLQRVWATMRTAETGEWGKVTVDELAERVTADAVLDDPLLAQMGQTIEETKKLPQALQLTNEFFDDPNLLIYFKLMDEPLTVQTIDRLIPGRLVRWTDKEVVLEVAPNLHEHFKLRDFKPSKGVQKLRLFRGTPENFRFPRNRQLELRTARGQIGRMEAVLWKDGRMLRSDINKLRKFVNPRVKSLRDWTEHELHTYSTYLTKLKKGEALPDPIMEQIKIYGPAETDVRVGIGATMRPARWMFETLNKGLPWMMDKFFYPFVKAVERRNINQLQLMDHIRALAEGLSRKDLRRIYEIDKYIGQRITQKYGSPAYINIRTGMLDMKYRGLAKKIGQAKADRLREAHDGFRELFDKMFKNLSDAGLIDKKRYIKEYWPLLRERSIVKEMFKAKKGELVPNLPRQIEGFMQKVRKNVIDNPETDILRLSQAYVSVYTKLMHLRPAVDDMYALFKDFRVKADVRRIMKHFASRQLGIPSEADYAMAATARAGLKYLPFIGKHVKGFGTYDWLRMGQLLNNLPYYAHMGLRPFAAARNLMQPFLTTGPMIGNRWLVRGYQLMTRKEARRWIREIGGLQESLGEYTRRLHIKPKFRDKFANALMWMFRGSDEMNRMAAGLGMASKFDHFFNKLGMTEEFFTKMKLRRFRDSVRLRVRDKARVYRAMKEIETHKYPTSSPAYKEAKNIIDEFSHGEKYVRSSDVIKDMRETITKEAIGDTQWLYGKDQSPLFGWKYGFMGRQAMTYQTWWLNYLEFTKNLFRTARSGDYMPLATAFANNMLLFFALTSIVGWEGAKVWRTIGLGPFSGKTVWEGEIPPGVDPFVKVLGGVRAALMGDFEGAEKRLETAMKKSWDNWLPGSLVYKELRKIGVTPSVTLWGTKLTPRPTKRYREPHEKVLSIFGAK